MHFALETGRKPADTEISVRMSRINLDIERLRAVAILLVLVSHGQALFAWTKYQALIAGYQFQIGVDLFFIISGYVITESLFREIGKKREGDPVRYFLFRFWIRRAFRLLPAAAISVSVSTLISWLAFHESLGLMVKAGLAAAFNVFNFYLLHAIVSNISVGMLEPYWSLSLEEQFYIIFPIVFLLFSARPKLALVAILCAAAIELAFSSIPQLFWFIRVDGLCGGVFLACISTYIKRIGAYVDNPKLFGLVALLICIPVAVDVTALVPGFMGAQTIPLISCILLVSIAVMNVDCFAFPAIGKILAYLGSRSYTVYLLHLTWFYCVGRMLTLVAANLGGWAIFIAFASILLFVALVECMFRFVETPFRVLGKKLADRMGSNRRSPISSAMPMRDVTTSSTSDAS